MSSYRLNSYLFIQECSLFWCNFADLEGGSFESVSPKSLDSGDHEVVLYADRPEEGTRSVPVKLRFTIVKKLAKGGTHEAAGEQQILFLFAIGAGMVLLVGLLSHSRKKLLKVKNVT